MEPNIKQKGRVAVLKWNMTSIGCIYYKVQDNDQGPILYANCITSHDNSKSVMLNFTIQPRLESYIMATRVMVREIANDNKGHRVVIGLTDAQRIVSLVAKELNSLGFEVNNISPQELVGTREIM